MLGSGPVGQPLRVTNTQVGPSAAQCWTLLPNFHSLFVRISVEPFKTVLMRTELIMGHANEFWLLTWACIISLPKFVPRILTADRKQQCVSICEELHQIASDNASSFPRVITGDESWIYGYDPETKQQSYWKSPNSPRLKKVRQVKSKVKSMLIIFFDIKGIDCSQRIRPGRPNSQFHILL
jgi:hypothetical protein